MNTQSTHSSDLSVQDYLRQLGKQAREASRSLMRLSDQKKSAAWRSCRQISIFILILICNLINLNNKRVLQ